MFINMFARFLPVLLYFKCNIFIIFVWLIFIILSLNVSAMRGFMTARGVPDCPRSSRYILKDFVNVSWAFRLSSPKPKAEG